MWHYVNGNFCLLLCEESKLLYERTERREREGEIEGGRNRWSERDKGGRKIFTQAFPDALGHNDVDGSASLPFVSSYFQEALQSPSLPLSLRRGHWSKISEPQEPRRDESAKKIINNIKTCMSFLQKKVGIPDKSLDIIFGF